MLPPRGDKLSLRPTSATVVLDSTKGLRISKLYFTLCYYTVRECVPTTSTTYLCVFNQKKHGAVGGIRTHTWQALDLLPLPIGLRRQILVPTTGLEPVHHFRDLAFWAPGVYQFHPRRHIFNFQGIGGLGGIRIHTLQGLNLLSASSWTTRPDKQKIPDPYFRRDRGF